MNLEDIAALTCENLENFDQINIRVFDRQFSRVSFMAA